MGACDSLAKELLASIFYNFFIRTEVIIKESCKTPFILAPGLFEIRGCLITYCIPINEAPDIHIKFMIQVTQLVFDVSMFTIRAPVCMDSKNGFQR